MGNEITATKLFQKLDFLNKDSLDLLREFAFQIKDEFHTLKTTFDYNVNKTEEDSKVLKDSSAIFSMNNDYTIECMPSKDSGYRAQWNAYVYKQIGGNHKELVFTFSFTDKNLEDIGTTVKVFCAGTPNFKVNNNQQL